MMEFIYIVMFVHMGEDGLGEVKRAFLEEDDANGYAERMNARRKKFGHWQGYYVLATTLHRTLDS